MTPATSVIIPCYNGEQYLYEALDSVKIQSVPVKEIVITDDGSKVPLRAPEKWAGPPINIIRTPNRGLAAARNTALAHATGEFVAFLDSDDLWEPRKIEAQEATLRADPNAVACYTRCANAPGFFGFGPYPPADVGDDEFLAVLWNMCFFPPSAVLARRETVEQVGRFREDFINGEDWELWLRLLSRGRIVQVPGRLTKYRVHPNQFTANIWKKVYGGKEARRAAMALHSEPLSKAGIPRSRQWDAYRSHILLVFYRRQFTVARSLLWDYWKDHPGDLRIFGYWLVSLLPAGLVTRLRGRSASSAGGSDAQNDGPDAWEKLKTMLPVDWTKAGGTR